MRVHTIWVLGRTCAVGSISVTLFYEWLARHRRLVVWEIPNAMLISVTLDYSAARLMSAYAFVFYSSPPAQES